MEPAEAACKSSRCGKCNPHVQPVPGVTESQGQGQGQGQQPWEAAPVALLHGRTETAPC